MIGTVSSSSTISMDMVSGDGLGCLGGGEDNSKEDEDLHDVLLEEGDCRMLLRINSWHLCALSHRQTSGDFMATKCMFSLPYG